MRTTYTQELAACLRGRCDEGCETLLGPTDAELCAKALLYMDKRASNRGRLGRVLMSVLPALAIGLGFADLNGDGQSTFADVAVATQIIWRGVPRAVNSVAGVPAAAPAVEISRSSIVPMVPGNPPGGPIHRRS